MTRLNRSSSCCSGSSSCCGSASEPCGLGGCPPGCCEQIESIKARPALDRTQRRRLAILFKVLANDTRLRLLHAIIKHGEVSVNDLAEELEMKPQAVSNQLQRLFVQQIVESRREGNLIFYRVVDPCVTMLLDLGLCLLEYKPTQRNRKRSSRAKS